MLRVLAICVAVLLGSSTAQAEINCEPLRPNPPRNLSTEAIGKIDAKIAGALSKFFSAGGSLDGAYKESSQGILQEYPHADTIYIWERILYIRCEDIRTSHYSYEQKQQIFNDLLLRLQSPHSEKIGDNLYHSDNSSQGSKDDLKVVFYSYPGGSLLINSGPELLYVSHMEINWLGTAVYPRIDEKLEKMSMIKHISRTGIEDFERMPWGQYQASVTGIPSASLIESAKRFGISGDPWCVCPIFITVDHPELLEMEKRLADYHLKIVTSPAEGNIVVVSGRTGKVAKIPISLTTVYMLRYTVDACKGLAADTTPVGVNPP